MIKQKKLLLFVLLISILFYGNYVCAFEILPKDYPKIPFTQPITENSKLPDFIVYFFALGIYLAGAISVISLAIGGIQFIFSSVSPEARSNAIDRIKSAILGLILVLASFIIVCTINPELENIENKTALQQVGGIHLKGSGGETSAPMSASDTSGLLQKYSEIIWPENVKNLDGKPKKNCDKNSGQYVIYFYKNKNFDKILQPTWLKCGESITLQGGSYYIKKESPGVYLYPLKDCELYEDSNIPIVNQKSLPEWSQNYASMRVVNGDDEYSGPFFGVILHGNIDFKGNMFAHFFPSLKPGSSESTGGRCINFPIVPNTRGPNFEFYSATIYKWVGFDKDKKPLNAGEEGVILHSWKSFRGGGYEINSQTMGNGTSPWQVKLENAVIHYPLGSPVPKEEQKQCENFITKQYLIGDTGNYNNIYCLKSLEIRGNYLVLLYGGDKKDPTNETMSVSNQRFPISPRLQVEYSERPDGYSLERGSPDLNLDWINNTLFNNDSGKATWIEVVPLAERLTQ